MTVSQGLKKAGVVASTLTRLGPMISWSRVVFMSPVSQYFILTHRVSIGLRNVLRMVASILWN